MSILESIKNYMQNFSRLVPDAPMFSDHTVGEAVQYTVVQQPGTRILEEDIMGNQDCQYSFAFQSIESTMDETQRLQNAEFFEELEAWFIQQTNAKVFPVMNANQFPEALEVLTSGYLMQDQTGTGVYQVQCRLLYKQKVQ